MDELKHKPALQVAKMHAFAVTGPSRRADDQDWAANSIPDQSGPAADQHEAAATPITPPQGPVVG
jgi:hypothetical protein